MHFCSKLCKPCSNAILSLFIYLLQSLLRPNNSLVKCTAQWCVSSSINFVAFHQMEISIYQLHLLDFNSIRKHSDENIYSSTALIRFQINSRALLHFLYTSIQCMYLLWLLSAHPDVFLQLISLYFIRLQ